MLDNKIRNELIKISRPKGREFQSRIVNSSYPVLGSRVGDIRKLAKKSVREDNQIYLDHFDSVESYEELLLRGFILAYDKHSILDKTELIESYLNLADSWALIDSFCSTFKIKNEEKETLFNILKDYLKQDDEFLQRYAQIMLLSHYLKFDLENNKLSRPKIVEMKDLESNFFNPETTYLENILKVIDKSYSSYYSSMGAAWLIAEAFLFFPKRILKFLSKTRFDNNTLNRTINKIRESKTPSKEVKVFLKELKRKE